MVCAWCAHNLYGGVHQLAPPPSLVVGGREDHDTERRAQRVLLVELRLRVASLLEGEQLRHQLVERGQVQLAAARRVVLLDDALHLHRVRLHSELPQRLLELISVDVAAPVRVEHGEGLAHVLRHLQRVRWVVRRV